MCVCVRALFFEVIKYTVYCTCNVYYMQRNITCVLGYIKCGGREWLGLTISCYWSD